MTIATIFSRIRYGVEAPKIRVEADLLNGLPAFNIVGLPEKAVNESRERVRSAIINSGFTFPNRRITINLSPADLPKEGGGQLDLAIAISILAASDQIKSSGLQEYDFLAELALSGELLPIRGLIPAALATTQEKRILIISKANEREACLLKDIHAYSADHIIQVVAHLEGKTQLTKVYPKHQQTTKPQAPLKIEKLIGQQTAKRALLIAAAGGHHLLMVGPPGSGKTLLASCLIDLLPPLTDQEALEVAKIASISIERKAVNWGARPFRAPHHTASAIALIGGGAPPIPGEISLAHQGILFLDEFGEFNRHALETLRQPLESGEITIARATHRTHFPASFQLIAAMNPCPCGNHGDRNRECRCTPDQIRRYTAKISGPLLDRMDLVIRVPAVPYTEIHKRDNTNSGIDMQQKVLQARHIQLSRANKVNTKLDITEIEKYCTVTKSGEIILKNAMSKLNLSLRGYNRTLKVARTIADIEQIEQIKPDHLSEALGYRHVL